MRRVFLFLIVGLMFGAVFWVACTALLGVGLTVDPSGSGLWELVPGALFGLIVVVALATVARPTTRAAIAIRILSFLFLSFLLVWAFYYPLPDIGDLTYDKARARIIGDGWYPIELEKKGGWWEKARDRYPEVISCAASVDSCQCGFRRFGFQCITVATDHNFTHTTGISRGCLDGE